MSIRSLRRFVTAGAIALVLAPLASRLRAQDSPEPPPPPIEAAEAKPEPAEPFSRIVKDIALDATAGFVADAGAALPAAMQPAGVMIWASWQAVDFSHDVAKEAVTKQNRWLDTELIIASRDAAALQKIPPGERDGPEARALRDKVLANIKALDDGGRSKYGTFSHAVLQNLPYAVSKVAVDKAISKAIGFGIGAIGLDALIQKHVPLPEKIRWTTGRQGPLARFQKDRHWGKLGTRAAKLEEAAAEAMRDAEKKSIGEAIKGLGVQTRAEAGAEWLDRIYRDIMLKNPSVKTFRRQAAVQVSMVAAPRPIEPAILAAPVPIIRAAEPIAAPVALEPLRITAIQPNPDPLVRVITTDDVMWRPASSRSSSPSSPPPAPAPSTPAPPTAQDARDAARRQALHEELMRVGDGRTYVLCSNGCPNVDGSWDGAKGQTLKSK